jgi:endonuclease/exonuclease/phosphatase family metal-dependent hydrolase
LPSYTDLDPGSERDRRTADRLLAIKGELEHQIPRRTIDNLLLATWNIREFDSPKYGERSQEALLYIAEIVSRFDIVAVQEVRDDLEALNRLRYYLGRWWRYILTDVTEGVPGNQERMAFLYDERKVSFGGLAGEVVIPPIAMGGSEYRPADQLARTPFIVGFRVGWFAFTICTTHILYGSDAANEPRRVEEIGLLSEFLAARAREPLAWAPNMILLGDFNIYSPEDLTMQALIDAGFVVPDGLKELPSNAPRTKFYDQIAFITMDAADQLRAAKGGVFNYYASLYKEDDEMIYVDDMGAAYETTSKGDARDEAGKRRYYRDWRTYQMSDHLPMWVELNTEFSGRYLKQKSEGQTPEEDATPTMLRNVL